MIIVCLYSQQLLSCIASRNSPHLTAATLRSSLKRFRLASQLAAPACCTRSMHLTSLLAHTHTVSSSTKRVVLHTLNKSTYTPHHCALRSFNSIKLGKSDSIKSIESSARLYRPRVVQSTGLACKHGQSHVK